MTDVASADGTRIAYQITGSGPPLILVDGALCSREFGPSPSFAKALAPYFTVVTWDRRGRGASGDTPPYAKEKELEDLGAVIRQAGGRASLLGFSSGAALSLEAAAAGLPIDRVAAYEPPYLAPPGGATPDHQANLSALVAAGKRSEALEYFLRDMVHVPGPMVIISRLMWWMWRKLEAVAHTLPYDAAVMGDFRVPRERLAKIAVPTLAMAGGKTTPALKEAAQAVAQVVPGAQHRTIPGQGHNVSAAALCPTVIEFLRR